MKSTIVPAILITLFGGCSSSDSKDSAHRDGQQDTNSSAANPDSDTPTVGGNILEGRVVSYSEALRTASLKLVLDLPNLQQIERIATAANPRDAYETEIDAMLADPRFSARMISWWRDTMRQGGGAGPNGQPSRDTAPVFAARITVEGRPYTDLFTATSHTCPTYDDATKTFQDGECNNGVAVHAGVLTNPGVMMQFYGNMAFRRVRWVQEIFACTKFPAEYAQTPLQVEGADYTAPWHFDAVATSPINFQDTSSVVCANCHASINRIAPLFARFDQLGQWKNDSQVSTPTVPNATKTEMSHWLNAGEMTAWRFGKPASDLPALGKAMAEDPDVMECAVARMYNFTMSKEDIVTDLATVPRAVLKPFVEEFMSAKLNLKATLRAILVSDDFVRF